MSRPAAEVRPICEICECFDDEHDYEHFARVCYPLEIQKLRAELDAAGKRIESLVIEAGAYDDLLAEMRERAEKAERDALPEAPPDERETLRKIIRVERDTPNFCSLCDRHSRHVRCQCDEIASKILAAGWRRNPC